MPPSLPSRCQRTSSSISPFPLMLSPICCSATYVSSPRRHYLPTSASAAIAATLSSPLILSLSTAAVKPSSRRHRRCQCHIVINVAFCFADTTMPGLRRCRHCCLFAAIVANVWVLIGLFTLRSLLRRRSCHITAATAIKPSLCNSRRCRCRLAASALLSCR